MTNIDTLINRIDQEFRTAIKHEKAAWSERTQAIREREERIARYEPVARHVIDLLKPRMAALVERFKAVVKAEPSVSEQTRDMTLTFAATMAKVTLTFDVHPDRDVSRIRLVCTQDIVPVVVPCDKPSALEFPLDAVPDDAVVEWFDDRVVAFVKAYMAVVRQDAELLDQLADQLVEDPVAKIRFPKYLASSTLQRDGKTWYFVDADTRREFEKTLAANK